MTDNFSTTCKDYRVQIETLLDTLSNEAAVNKVLEDIHSSRSKVTKCPPQKKARCNGKTLPSLTTVVDYRNSDECCFNK